VAAIVTRKELGGFAMTNQDCYYPTGLNWEESQLAKWMNKHGYTSMDKLYQSIADDPGWFWGEVEKELGITWLSPYNKVFDSSQGIKWTKWYTEGKLNLAIDAVDKHAQGEEASKAAVYWEGDDGSSRILSYSDLYKETNRFANGLKKLGVVKGDCIALYLPMIPEAVIAMLGVVKIGAIVIPCFSGFGAESVANRLNDSEAKVMITADGFFRRGKKVQMINEARKAVEEAKAVEHLIVVNRTGSTEMRQSSAFNCKEIDYLEFTSNQEQECSAEPMDSEDPFLVIYTSGTTGKPKGVVHVHGGFPIKVAQDLIHVFDFRKEDVLLWVTDMGWIMGPFMVYGALLLGGSIVIHEGTPDYPNPSRLWELVEKYQITHLGISPTAIRTLMTYGSRWYEGHDLSSLRAFGSTGEPWNPVPWLWLFEDVGKGRIPIINHSGGTEIGGGILGCLPGHPLKPCSFNGPIPGMVVDIIDGAGNPVKAEVGELVIRAPWPGMTRGFWKNPKRYEETYWGVFPDLWVHGDWAKTDNDGYWYIEGRSDDTLKIAGKRIGPAEFESILISHESVTQAAVIGVPDEIKGTAGIGFIVLSANTQRENDMKEKIINELNVLVSKQLGKPFVLKAIFEVKDIPRTRNGKVLRRVIQAAYMGKEAGDLSSLENPQAVEEVKQFASEIIGN
jgi:acetyl-CoA synthetase